MKMDSTPPAAADPVVIRRGRGEDPKPLKHSDTVVRMDGCPDCSGRGWFLINPFATGGPNGMGGIGNQMQCLTCLDCKTYYDQHGKLPPEIAKEMEAT